MGYIVLYTEPKAFNFNLHCKQEYLSLTKLIGALPSMPNDCNYYKNKAKLQCDIVASDNAVLFNSDIVAAQNCLERATELIQNQSKYF